MVMDEAQANKDRPGFRGADVEFHRIINEAADNRFLLYRTGRQSCAVLRVCPTRP